MTADAGARQPDAGAKPSEGSTEPAEGRPTVPSSAEGPSKGRVKLPRAPWRRRLDRTLWVVLALLVCVLVEILVPVWPCPYPHHDQAVLVTQRHIDTLCGLAYGYRVTRGRYPPTLSQLIEGDPELRMADVDRDGWDRTFFYRNPGTVNTHAFDLYSPGRNGVDDGGRGDDITNSSEPEPLYYGYDHHRGLLNSLIFDVGAAFALGWCVWVLVRFRRVYYPVLRRRALRPSTDSSRPEHAEGRGPGPSTSEPAAGRGSVNPSADGRRARQEGPRLPELRFFRLPVWLGAGLAAILVTAAFLSYPRLKAEYYSWRWMYLAGYPNLNRDCRYWRMTFLIPRPPGGPHTNTDDAAEVLIHMGSLAAPVVAAKLSHPVASGRLKLPLREQMVKLLGLMGDLDVTPTLRDLLLGVPGDPTYVPHATVAQALRRLGDRSTTWFLLDDIGKQGITSFWSAKALELVTWMNFGDLRPDLPREEAARRVALWMDWWRQNQELEESEWLRQGVEQALSQLASDDPYLRATAIRRLRRVTGMHFFCEYYMLLGDRQRAAVVWRRWWEEHQERFRNADFDTVDRPLRTVSSIYVLEW